MPKILCHTYFHLFFLADTTLAGALQTCDLAAHIPVSHKHIANSPSSITYSWCPKSAIYTLEFWEISCAVYSAHRTALAHLSSSAHYIICIFLIVAASDTNKSVHDAVIDTALSACDGRSKLLHCTTAIKVKKNERSILRMKNWH